MCSGERLTFTLTLKKPINVETYERTMANHEQTKGKYGCECELGKNFSQLLHPLVIAFENELAMSSVLLATMSQMSNTLW